jgi:hypothetical protein
VATILRGALGPRYQVENSTSDADSLVVRKVKLGWLFRAHVRLAPGNGQIELRGRPGGVAGKVPVGDGLALLLNSFGIAGTVRRVLRTTPGLG